MLALLAAVLFSVVTILHLVWGVTVAVVLFDLGLVCLALGLSTLATWPASISWRR